MDGEIVQLHYFFKNRKKSHFMVSHFMADYCSTNGASPVLHKNLTLKFLYSKVDFFFVFTTVTFYFYVYLKIVYFLSH